MIQFNDGPQSAAKISFSLIEILNLALDEPMSLKRKRNLLQQGSDQGFYKIQITMYQVKQKDKKKKKMKKGEVTYLEVSEYTSVAPDI